MLLAAVTLNLMTIVQGKKDRKWLYLTAEKTES